MLSTAYEPLLQRIVVTSSPSRAIVHHACIVYIALPSDSSATTRPVGARHRGADRDRQSLPDRAAGEAEPVVGWPAGGGAGREQSRGVAFVGDDRTFGEERAERRADGLRGERAGGQLGPGEGLADG